jgi:hypothetical protein
MEVEVDVGMISEVGTFETDMGVTLGMEAAAGLEIMVVEVVGVEAVATA